MIGSIHKTNDGGSVQVLEYENNKQVLVKHLDDHGHEAWVTADNLRNGQVKNPYHPSVYGKGYLGIGRHGTRKNGKHTPVYVAWLNMLRRCYDPKYHARNPTYVGCSVAPEWLCFQTFADWFELQCREDGWHLDKDLLVEGNKAYSPEMCMFVPSAVNSLFTDAGAARGAYPIGVNRKGKGYRAELNKRGKREYLGYFTTVRRAQVAYSNAKANHVLDLLETDFRYLPERIKNAIFLKIIV